MPAAFPIPAKTVLARKAAVLRRFPFKSGRCSGIGRHKHSRGLAIAGPRPASRLDQCRRVTRRVKKRLQLVVELEQGDGKTGHV